MNVLTYSELQAKLKATKKDLIEYHGDLIVKEFHEFVSKIETLEPYYKFNFKLDIPFLFGESYSEIQDELLDYISNSLSKDGYVSDECHGLCDIRCSCCGEFLYFSCILRV